MPTGLATTGGKEESAGGARAEESAGGATRAEGAGGAMKAGEISERAGESANRNSGSE